MGSSVDFDVVVVAVRAAVRWLAAEPNLRTREKYAQVLGLPYVAYELGFCDEIADEAEARRVDVRCGPPGIRSRAPHLTWLAYTLSRGLDPLDCGVCDDVAPMWAREMGEWRGVAGEELARNTRAARVAAARKFYSYATRKSIACCHPFDGFRNRQLGIRVGEPRDGRVFTPEQLARLQIAADTYRGQGEFYRRRASALVSVCRDIGPRVNELRGFDVRDFVRRSAANPPTLLIRNAKGNIARRCTISDDTEQRLVAMLMDRPETLIPGDKGLSPLFASKPRGDTAHHPESGRIGVRVIEDTIRNICDGSGWEDLRDAAKWFRVHGFRASLLTNGFDDGRSAQELAAFIGHRSIAATEAYDRNRAQRGFRLAEQITRNNSRELAQARGGLRAC